MSTKYLLQRELSSRWSYRRNDAVKRSSFPLAVVRRAVVLANQQSTDPIEVALKLSF